MDYRFYWGVSLIKAKRNMQTRCKHSNLLLKVRTRKKVSLPYFTSDWLVLELATKNCARQSLEAYKDSPTGVPTRKTGKGRTSGAVISSMDDSK